MTPSRPAIFAPRRAFTLVEILIVVAIIITLIAILIPSIGKVKTMAQVSAAKAELGAIQNGLQQYYNLFHVYPPSTGSQGYLGTAGRSPAMLAQGLMGYLDYAKDGAGPSNPGDPAFGFRTRKSAMGGEIYGPYMQSDPKVFKFNSTTDQVFIDPWGHEILYFVAQRLVPDTTLPAITKVFDVAAARDSFFAFDDCTITFDGTVLNAASPSYPPATPPFSSTKFYPLFTPGTTNNYSAGTVTGADSFLLLSAGPDGIYFTADDIVVGKN